MSRKTPRPGSTSDPACAADSQAPGQRRFLAGLPIDPDRLPRPLPPPGPHDFIICGCPKTGTTMLAAMLWQPPRMLVCSEPWDGMRMPPDALFRSLRREIAATGRLGRSRLDVPALLAESRVRWTEDEEKSVPVTVDDGYLLGVKWPAFWRYLDLLQDTKFLVCLRHPYEVVHSFIYSSPTLREGADYDTAFNRTMNTALQVSYPDRAMRRVKLYDTINARILEHLHRPNVLPVRHEHWFTEPNALRAEISEFLGVGLTDRVRLRRPQGGDDPQVRALVRAHCETASPLGYALD